MKYHIFHKKYKKEDTYVFKLFILYTFLNELFVKRKESIKLPLSNV
jgi:hypothetical protein